MSRCRSGYDSDQSYQHSSIFDKHSTAPVHSPRRGQFAGPASNDLYRTPVALNVSQSGERTILPVDKLTAKVTNPFTLEANRTMDVGLMNLSKTPIRKEKASKKRINSIQRKRHKTGKTILTQRISARPQLQAIKRCVSVQTDPAVSNTSRPVEFIGDTGNLCKTCLQLSVSPKICQSADKSNFKGRKRDIDKLLAELMPETMKVLTSFVIMITLVFWLISIILDVDLISDFSQIVVNYMGSFKWSYYQKEPPTSTEKYLDYLRRYLN